MLLRVVEAGGEAAGKAKEAGSRHTHGCRAGPDSTNGSCAPASVIVPAYKYPLNRLGVLVEVRRGTGGDVRYGDGPRENASPDRGVEVNE